MIRCTRNQAWKMAERNHARLVDQFGPHALHVLVRLDHLGVVVVRSCEWDVMFRCQFTRDGYLVEGNLIARNQYGWESSSSI